MRGTCWTEAQVQAEYVLMDDPAETVTPVHVAAVFADDPFDTLPLGAEFAIEPTSFSSSDSTTRLAGVRNWGFFDGALLAVALKSQDSLAVDGSAVMIAPGLAVTAAHVLRSGMEDMAAGRIVPYAVGTREGGLDLWRATAVAIDDGDVAYLSLSLNSDISDNWRLRCVPTTTRAPRNGELLTMVGFRTAEVTQTDTGVTLVGELLAASGPVQAVYPNGRDRVLVSFPAVELGCASRGAMSGGAVLDASGHLVGVISAGMDVESGDGPSYAVWIAPTLSRKVQPSWPAGLYPEATPVVSAITFVEGRQYLKLTPEGGDLQIWFGSDPLVEL